VKVCSFGEELPDQSVGILVGASLGILVGASLSRTSRMGEIDFDTGDFGKQFVLGHFSSLVISY
jgi:hypothetical protein